MFATLIKTLLLSGLFLCSSINASEGHHLVDHVDTISIDNTLNLHDLINNTLQKYPDTQLIKSLHQESVALKQRGERWIADTPSISLAYKNDFVGSDQGAYEFDGGVDIPLWNWGQRDAGLALAHFAKQAAERQADVVILKITGLVRKALWHIKLQDLQHRGAKKSYHLTAQLVDTVNRRVELGDLAKADLLLIQSELLQKKSILLHAEAELMHARKAYYFLTQDTVLPAQIEEQQSLLQTLPEKHPDLAIMNARIQQKQAYVYWLKKQGSGQNSLSIGGITERGMQGESTIDSIRLGFSMPFGGEDFAAPKIATAQRQLIEVKTEKLHLYRALLSKLHEAEHELDIERSQLIISQKMRKNAEAYLKMASISFNAGEINLMDYLKIQARSQHAIQQAQSSAIKLQRDIAFYNQAIGVTP